MNYFKGLIVVSSILIVLSILLHSSNSEARARGSMGRSSVHSNFHAYHLKFK